MAMSEHLLRYRSETSEDLATMKADLVAQETIYSQQAMGSKNHTRDLKLLSDKINAISFVLRERGATTIVKAQINHNIGITDFSNV